MVSDINFLLVGNSRLHWANYSQNQSKFFHTKKEQKVPENINVNKLSLQRKIKIFWIDTGYLPPETYHYAEKLIEDLSLEVEVLQSELSPARMEAKYGRLWETNKESDLDKYHELRKI